MRTCHLWLNVDLRAMAAETTRREIVQMRLKRPFLRLPIRFSAAALAQEIAALPNSAWEPHPLGHPGNDAVPLITPGGRMTTDFAGPMAPTPHLLSCAYIQQLMAEIGAVWGRSRLMGLAPGAEVPTHVDINYYWRTHLRLHIPIITSPQVLFTCGDATVHMQPGECWLFDSFRMHGVRNGGSQKRIHLVLDTVGGDRLADLIEQAEGVDQAADPGPPVPRSEPGRRPELAFERVNAPRIMSPWEVRCHVAFLLEETREGPALEPVRRRLNRFTEAWAAAWAQFGDGDDGIPTFRALVVQTRDDLYGAGADTLRLSNSLSLFLALRELVFRMAVPRPDQR